MPPKEQQNLKEKVRQLPDGPGVYLMKDRFGSILYVGKAKNLKRRVSSYFQPSRKFRLEQPKIIAMIDLVESFDILEVRNESEALLLEGRLIKEWKPKYNTDFTDDKRFLLVRVDQNSPLPKFRLVRFRKDDQALYFGPYAHSGLLRKTLQELRLKFGILLGDATPEKKEDGRWQLYNDARAEIYGHSNLVTEAEYRQRIEKAAFFLEGKTKQWLEDLRVEMTKASENLDFEKAAELRDILKALEKTILKNRKFSHTPNRSGLSENGVRKLQEVLELPYPPKTMECFDISHISGTYCVASMVRFQDGAPDKRHYRRFKIKSFIGNDDFRAMEEVVGRRYRRLKDENKAFPDLIIIDGGPGQVGSALKAFLGQGIEPPPLIGLAKKEETIIFSDERSALKLPAHHPGRLLLQRIRDEAHRFANTFNAELRRKKIKETILMEFDGLGPAKRAAIWEKFTSIDSLMNANPEKIAEVDGIGIKTAQNLYAFLHQ